MGRLMRKEFLHTNMDIRTVTWEQTISLRHRVLLPSQPPEYCHIEGDVNGLHFDAFINGILVCVASVYLEQNKARLRKFATDVNYQNQGIGAKMLSHIIHSLKGYETEVFWCDARESAIGFYKRFDMHKCSERFYKADVAYFAADV